jgi:hypothetical protein
MPTPSEAWTRSPRTLRPAHAFVGMVPQDGGEPVPRGITREPTGAEGLKFVLALICLSSEIIRVIGRAVTDGI